MGRPGIEMNYREYFDDYTHVAVYSDRSLAHFLSVNGFEVKEYHARFLPLTIKPRIPVSAVLIRLYLALPISRWGNKCCCGRCDSIIPRPNRVGMFQLVPAGSERFS